MLVVHHGSNFSTCSRRISFTRLVIIPLVPGEKVSAVMFCKQFLAYAVHIDWCNNIQWSHPQFENLLVSFSYSHTTLGYHSIHKHTSGSQHAPI